MKKRMSMVKVPKFKGMGGGVGTKTECDLDPFDVCKPADGSKKSHGVKKKMKSMKK